MSYSAVMIRSGWKQEFSPRISFKKLKTKIRTFHPNPKHSVFNGEDLDGAIGKAGKS